MDRIDTGDFSGIAERARLTEAVDGTAAAKAIAAFLVKEVSDAVGDGLSDLAYDWMDEHPSFMTDFRKMSKKSRAIIARAVLESPALGKYMKSLVSGIVDGMADYADAGSLDEATVAVRRERISESGDRGCESEDLDAYSPILKIDGEYLGHGIDETGSYEGFMVDGEPRYYYVKTGKEVLDR